jgi:hypothetical protein
MTIGLSPLEGGYLDRLGELINDARETGRGRVVFVAGGPVSGRSFWLDTTAQTLSDACVMAGGFLEGKYVERAIGDSPAVSPEAATLINSIAGLGVLVGPIGALIGQLITISVAGRQVVQALQRKGQRVEVLELLPGLLRAAAAEHPAPPLVCLIDDADMAEGSWWTTLLLSFAQEVEQELPLVLVMGIDGPMELGDVPREEESDACAVARSLRRRGLGEWWPLRALSWNEVASWIGPASPELLSSVWKITEGAPGEIRELWEGWAHRGAIRQDDEGRWRIVGDVEHTLAEAGERFSVQLATLVGGDKLELISDAGEVLACAALEGSTFTAEAVARAGLGPRRPNRSSRQSSDW